MIRSQLHERKMPFDELFVEYPGLNSAHGPLAPLPPAAELNERAEIWVRMVLRTRSKPWPMALAAFPLDGAERPGLHLRLSGHERLQRLAWASGPP